MERYFEMGERTSYHRTLRLIRYKFFIFKPDVNTTFSSITCKFLYLIRDEFFNLRALNRANSTVGEDFHCLIK